MHAADLRHVIKTIILARIMNIAMEELAPLVSKVCVLQQKAPLEVSSEKRHLLELLEKRHKRYLEKKSCEALEPDVPYSKLIEGGLDNGEYSSHSIVPTHTLHLH